MAVTYASFIAEFPTFSEVEQVVIDAKIADAQARIDEAAFGDIYDVAVKYLAAHLLTIPPYGMQLGPQESPAKTSFGEEFEKIKLLSHRRGHITGGGLS